MSIRTFFNKITTNSTSPQTPGRLDAVDVSRWQGTVNWAEVKKATAGHLAIFKATQGSGWVDPELINNRANTEKAGFTHRIAYHWISPKVDIQTQCDHFIKTFGNRTTGEGIMLDIEENGITLTQAQQMADRLEQHYGVPVAGYTGRYVANGDIWIGDKFFTNGRARIFAAYTYLERAKTIAAGETWDAWQFTSQATVPGISVNVDGNQVDNLPAFDRVCGLTKPPTTNQSMYVRINLKDGTKPISTVLIGLQDAKGRIFDLTWSGPGSDPNVQARLGFLGTDVIELDVGSLRLATFHGRLPYGDPHYTWTGKEFYSVVD